MNLLAHKNGRALLVFFLYLSEGAPIGFIWWAMPTILRSEQVAIEKITSLSALLVLPWVFKFLWAPLVDTFRTSRYGFKIWIMASQTIMGAALIPLVFTDPSTELPVWTLCLLIHAMAAATQDVSIDALVINTVATHERGILNGYMQAGMLVGRSVFGGGALVLLNSTGLPSIFVLLIASILITMILLLFVIEPNIQKEAGNRLKIFTGTLRQSFGKRITWLAILFALTAAAAFETAGALLGPFFTDMKVSDGAIGFFFAVPVVVSMLMGGLIGGKISDHFSRTKSVGLFLTGFAACVFIIAILKWLLPPETTFVYFFFFALMYFFVGMFTASSYAWFMDLTHPRLGATQFSTYMAATNGCEAWTVWVAGKITGLWDYSAAFLVMCIISFSGLLLLRSIRRSAN